MRRPNILNTVMCFLIVVTIILFAREKSWKHNVIEDTKEGNRNNKGIFTEPTHKKYQIFLKESSTYNQSKLVLLICYMRGGSTFVSEMFNENPTAMNLTEPIASMYVSMFATPMWQEPLEISHYHDGKPRSESNRERAFIIENLSRMFTCDFNPVPLEVLFHQAILNSNSLRPYYQCFRAKNPKQPFMRMCLDPLSRQCPKYIAQSIQNHCDIMKELAESNATLDDSRSDLMTSNKNTIINYRKFRNSVGCKKSYIESWNTCRHYMNDTCRSSKIRAFKLLRLPMSWTEELVKRYQGSIKVVHYVRDPRGIMTSRKAVESWDKRAALPAELESQLLCEKMLQNFQDFEKLRSLYPDTYKEIRYEDFADTPVETAKQMYEDIKMSVPRSVVEWLKRNTRSSHNGSEFQLFKENSSKTARAWRTKIKPSLKKHMDGVCKEVLEKLRYTA